MEQPCDRTIRIVWLAAFRDRIGRAEEAVVVDGSVTTLGALVASLSARGPVEAELLGAGSRMRAAVNRRIAGSDAALSPGDEVAFFPPFTGG